MLRQRSENLEREREGFLRFVVRAVEEGLRLKKCGGFGSQNLILLRPDSHSGKDSFNPSIRLLVLFIYLFLLYSFSLAVPKLLWFY